MVSFLPALKSLIEKIGGDNNKLIDISHDDNRTQTINLVVGDLSKSTPEQLKAIQQIGELLKPTIRSDGYELPARTSDKKLEEVEEFTANVPKKDVYNFVTTKIPEEDKYIWLSALMLRQASQEGKLDKVKQIKEQMVSEHQQRGRNIANICNAGYLEEYIIPWYTYYVEGNRDMESFLENYHNIVDHLLFAVFVSGGRGGKEIKSEIENKIQMLVNAHMDRLFIHAIGHANIETAKNVIDEIRAEMVPEIKDIREKTTNQTFRAEISL